MVYGTRVMEAIYGNAMMTEVVYGTRVMEMVYGTRYGKVGIVLQVIYLSIYYQIGQGIKSRKVIEIKLGGMQ